MQLTLKRARSVSPPISLETEAEQSTSHASTSAWSSPRALANLTTSLKRISTISTSARSCSPAFASPSLSRRSTSSSSASSAESARSSEPTRLSLSSTPPSSPLPSRRSSPAPSSSALHQEAKRIFETHYVLVESPSPPSSPILSPSEGPRAPRTTPTQGTTVQECVVM